MMLLVSVRYCLPAKTEEPYACAIKIDIQEYNHFVIEMFRQNYSSATCIASFHSTAINQL